MSKPKTRAAKPTRPPPKPRPRLHLVKTTHSRRFPLRLLAESLDGGPYYLVDLAGYGVAWKAPAYVYEKAEPDAATRKLMAKGLSSGPFTRRRTWVPIYTRAALALDICDLDDDVTAAEAKEAVDFLANRHPDLTGSLRFVVLAGDRIHARRAPKR